MRPIWGRVFLGALLLNAAVLGAQERPPNVLLLIGDDMGVDTLSLYGISSDTALTPTLDGLAEQGVVFEQFWTQPACTPTRAEMLTGRYGFRTGVMRQIGGPTGGAMPMPPPQPPEGSPREGRKRPGPDFRPDLALVTLWGPSADEFTIPHALKAGMATPYASAAFGKWHLADSRNGWLTHPNVAGFDHYSGSFGGFPEGYFAWREVRNGEVAIRTGYAISDKVDDALQWIEQQEDHPWFIWLSFNAPHQPLHKPPVELINTPELKELDPQANPPENPRPYFKALIEAMDTEIGRLLEEMDPDVLANTVVIFMGDNGSEDDVISAPFTAERSKESVHQGGIHTPLIVSGPGVATGRVTDGLAKAADLFATVIELSGRSVTDVVPAEIEIDSQSLVPYLDDPGMGSIRRFNYVDMSPANATDLVGNYAIRNDRYKYLMSYGEEEFYDLQSDPFEYRDLLEQGELTEQQQSALDELKSEVGRLRPDI